MNLSGYVRMGASLRCCFAAVCCAAAALPAVAELQNVEVGNGIRIRGNYSPKSGLEVTVRLEPGVDGGQGLGSLFEVKNAAGRVVLGAGFDDSHATYLRDNNRQVIFYYCAPNPAPEIAPLGKPFDSEHNGARLLVDADNLVTFFRYGSPIEFRTPAPEGGWNALEGEYRELGASFSGTQQVDNKRLLFLQHEIQYDGEIIYTTARTGGRYFYDSGRMFIYHNEPDQLYVVPWKPGETISLDGAEVHNLVGVVFTWGTYGDEFLVTTNVGEFYSYRDGTLTRHRATDGTSWQGYSMLRHYDKVLIGHYPTGSLYQYDENGLALFEPPIPVPAGVSVSAREAQTLAIHGGYLYAGVWPWGEVWRFDHEANAWEFVARMFERPELSAEDQEPFARAMKDKPAPYNAWGQRIVNLTNFRDGLYIATMNKQGSPWIPDVHDFLDEATVKQYGAVYKLTVPAQVAAPFTWKAQTELRFRAADGRLEIQQDGETIGTARLPQGAELTRLAREHVTVGNGIYGPSRGEVSLLGFGTYGP